MGTGVPGGRERKADGVSLMIDFHDHFIFLCVLVDVVCVIIFDYWHFVGRVSRVSFRFHVSAGVAPQ